MSPSARFLAQRLVAALVAVLGVLVVVFVVTRVIPGDPVGVLGGVDLAPEEMAKARQDLGLDRPLLTQARDYFGDVARGSFGSSIRTSRPVLGEVVRAFTNSALLVALATPISAVLGIGLGLVAVRWHHSHADRAVTMFVILAMSVPPFFLAILLVLLFSVSLQWLPATGIGGIEHVVMPVATIAVSTTPLLIRVTRANLLGLLGSGFSTTARAKGLGPIAVLARHTLPAGILPVVAVIGLQVAYTLGGIALVEIAFAYPGIGWLLVESISFRDFPMVQASVLLIALSAVVTNFVTDIAYVLLNPKLRTAGFTG